jgi:hypothetical protein
MPGATSSLNAIEELWPVLLGCCAINLSTTSRWLNLSHAVSCSMLQRHAFSKRESTQEMQGAGQLANRTAGMFEKVQPMQTY